MKKCTVLVLLAFLWGCQDDVPLGFSAPPTEEVQYGSSVIKLPGLALAKIAAGSIAYKFVLTITGDRMDTMTFNWSVDGSGQSFTIDKIPTGKSRMFRGILYGSNGATYEGIAYADIYSGKIAYVSLVLRRLGSAQVEVIIEDFEEDGIAGCYQVDGNADTVNFSGLVMNIMDITDSSLFVYFYRGGEMVGKFYGTLSNRMRMYGDFVIPGVIEGYLDAYLSSDFQSFKGEVYSIKDHAYPIGVMYGKKTFCDTIVPPDTIPPQKCFYDTLGGPGSTSCKDTATWIKYARETCSEKNALLTDYSFQSPCDVNDTSYYETVCFECCVKN
jgi:hypothetical protein